MDPDRLLDPYQEAKEAKFDQKSLKSSPGFISFWFLDSDPYQNYMDPYTCLKDFMDSQQVLNNEVLEYDDKI